MKAKDYAKKYFESSDRKDTIVEISRFFLLEIESLSDMRNIKTVTGLVPVCKELDKKWKKFAQLVNKKLPITSPIKYNGFKNLVRKASPELYSLWINEPNNL